MVKVIKKVRVRRIIKTTKVKEVKIIKAKASQEDPEVKSIVPSLTTLQTKCVTAIIDTETLRGTVLHHSPVLGRPRSLQGHEGQTNLEIINNHQTSCFTT